MTTAHVPQMSRAVRVLAVPQVVVRQNVVRYHTKPFHRRILVSSDVTEPPSLVDDRDVTDCRR